MVSRPSAPGSLELVEAFLRTRNEITDLATMRTWSAAHGLPGAMTREVYERALRLREALRSLMLANNGGPADPAAVDTVNAEITASGLKPQLTPDATRLRWPAPDDRALGAVLAGVVAAMTDGTWPRMKACAAGDCRYAFYDHTRNRSGRWCDVSGCGANARMRAYRQRRTTPTE
ncbi:MAG: CGNR zinc finger domain-containing protein [Actinoallomurus sp.]